MWKDPVWSKVISSIIIGISIFLYSKYKNISFNHLFECLKIIFLYKFEITTYQIILTIFIVRGLYFLYKKKTITKKKILESYTYDYFYGNEFIFKWQWNHNIFLDDIEIKNNSLKIYCEKCLTEANIILHQDIVFIEGNKEEESLETIRFNENPQIFLICNICKIETKTNFKLNYLYSNEFQSRYNFFIEINKKIISNARKKCKNKLGLNQI
jgi:hypothetical protein